MTVTLLNRTRRMQVFTLDHATYCEAHGPCACTVVDARTGRRVASSITLAAGACRGDLPEAVLKVKAIARAIAVGDLDVRRVLAAPMLTPKSSKPERRRRSTRKGSR